MFQRFSQGKDILLFQNVWMCHYVNVIRQQPIVFFSIQPTFLTVFWPSVKLAVCSLLFLLPGSISSRLETAVTASILRNDLLFKQPSNDISDREIRLQSLSGFSEIKFLIDGRKDEKGALPQYCQWLWLWRSLNRATFELWQPRRLVAFALYANVYHFCTLLVTSSFLKCHATL